MSLDVYLKEVQPVCVFSANITHNLTKMADAAGLYKLLWRPEEINIQTASQLISPLKEGLQRLLDEAAKYQAFNPPNGWGSYDGLVRFVRAYIEACEANPEASVEVSR